LTLKNHVHLRELLALLDNCLVLYKDAAVELANKETDELVPAVQPLILVVIRKQVVKIYIYELFKQISNYLLSKLRPQLV